MKRLGRGLSSILEDVEAGYLKDLPNRGVEEIEVAKIKANPYQPRREFNEEAIKELALSIKKYGLLQPVILIKDEDEYILVAGERRLRAIKSLGEKYIRAIIVDYSKNDLREYALIENIQREDLNPVEIAYSLQSLIQEHGYTHEELANSISKSRSYVTNLLRILNLPKFVQEKIKNKVLSVGHAKILIGLNDETLKKVIQEKVGKRRKLVDPSEEVALEMKNFIESHPEFKENLILNGEPEIYVSDITPNFERIAKLFLGRKIALKKVNLE